MLLYERGWNDTEIGEKLGCSAQTIGKWRQRHGLTANRKGSPMQKALSPRQCKAMQLFLSRMIALKDKYPNRKFDVMVFARVYREEGLVWEGREKNTNTKVGM